MIEATYLRAHRTMSSRRSKKGGYGWLIGQTNDGMNTKLHVITDPAGGPIKFFMNAGQVSDCTCAAAVVDSLPTAEGMIADRGYDTDWFGGLLKDNGTRPCIAG
jgi:hypothetical protein